MKKILIVLIAISFSSLSFAQPWTVNPAEYEFSMNFIGKASISGVIADDASNYIGAFVDDICVGVCSPIVDDNSEYQFFYLTVYSNQSSGEDVEFKFVDALDTETLISNSVIFNSDEIVGSADEPFIWFDLEEYASTDILSFSLEEQVSPAEINSSSHTVIVLVENGTSLLSLIPEFTLAPGAVVDVGIFEQESGVTSNDFTSDVIYVVTGADDLTTHWTVSVTVDDSGVEQFGLDMIAVYPNPASDYIMIDFIEIDSPDAQILDLQGRVVKQVIFDSERIDISNLEAGVYFLRYELENQVLEQKFVKK